MPRLPSRSLALNRTISNSIIFFITCLGRFQLSANIALMVRRRACGYVCFNPSHSLHTNSLYFFASTLKLKKHTYIYTPVVVVDLYCFLLADAVRWQCRLPQPDTARCLRVARILSVHNQLLIVLSAILQAEDYMQRRAHTCVTV
jgi:hypothetical protein